MTRAMRATRANNWCRQIIMHTFIACRDELGLRHRPDLNQALLVAARLLLRARRSSTTRTPDWRLAAAEVEQTTTSRCRKSRRMVICEHALQYEQVQSTEFLSHLIDAWRRILQRGEFGGRRQHAERAFGSAFHLNRQFTISGPVRGAHSDTSPVCRTPGTCHTTLAFRVSPDNLAQQQQPSASEQNMFCAGHTTSEFASL